ncbi:MAG: TATA-box-binding protein, partial [Candidatus Thermoplasmatota archaeon]|nr:TATA-box-binding protein [Candidatus Thermoplasmatota archaeon]
MADMKIENVVASTTIADELDLSQLSKKLPEGEYEPEQFPGLVLRLDEPKTAALLFRSGKVVCTGAKTID